MIYSGSMLMVVAPSGAGKSSLVSALMRDDAALTLSISFTTRTPRPGEENGRDYYFITTEEFLKRKEDGDFLEWALVHGNYYGTSKSWILEKMQLGQDVVLEIDWQGARQIQRIVPQALWIFILPPSLSILEERLRKRGQDDDATIERRVGAAQTELSHLEEADYLVVNDVFEQALSEVSQIVQASRLRSVQQMTKHHALVKQLTTDAKGPSTSS